MNNNYINFEKKDSTTPHSNSKCNKKNRITFVEVLTWLIFVPFSIAVFLVLGVSLCTTIYYDLFQEADLPRFGSENLPLLLILCAAVMFVIILIMRKTHLIMDTSGKVDTFEKADAYEKADVYDKENECESINSSSKESGSRESGSRESDSRESGSRESDSKVSGRKYINCGDISSDYSLQTGKPIKLSRMMKIALIWALVLSMYLILIVRGLATNDALQLNEIVNDFMQGDFSSFMNAGGYLFVYPFQIGYVACGQLLYILFGAGNYLVYQLLNVAAILATLWLLYRMTYELFGDRTVCNMMALLSMGMLFLYVYSTFVYGDIWSLAPETAALYFMILFFKYERLSDGIWAAVCMGCAVVLKTNAYIAVVAMAVMLILDIVRRAFTGKKAVKVSKMHNNGTWGIVLSRIFLIILLIAVPKSMTGIINTAYANAAGIDKMPEGVPSSTYFAMGMQEGATENGWYNGFNVNTYREAGYDRDKADEIAKAAISGRLSEFADRPLHAAHFYVGKFLSQWADPTCISMRELELTSRHVDGQPGIMNWIVYGMGRTVFQWIMNVFQTICYIGLAVYCIDVYHKKKLGFEQAFLILFIFGGMLFHELWEASSRYTMRYYIRMLPMAAFGIKFLCIKIEKGISRICFQSQDRK